MDARWNLDRKPSSAERAIGIFGALLLCGAGIAGLWFSAFVKHSLPASLVTGAFTALTVLLLFRFLFTTGRKIQRSGIIATAVAFTVAGVAMLVGSFFTDQISHRFYLLSLGAFGVGGGVLNFMKAKKEPIQPPQRNAGSRPSSRDSSASETPSSLGPRG